MKLVALVCLTLASVSLARRDSRSQRFRFGAGLQSSACDGCGVAPAPATVGAVCANIFWAHFNMTSTVQGSYPLPPHLKMVEYQGKNVSVASLFDGAYQSTSALPMNCTKALFGHLCPAMQPLCMSNSGTGVPMRSCWGSCDRVRAECGNVTGWSQIVGSFPMAVRNALNCSYPMFTAPHNESFCWHPGKNVSAFALDTSSFKADSGCKYYESPCTGCSKERSTEMKFGRTCHRVLERHYSPLHEAAHAMYNMTTEIQNQTVKVTQAIDGLMSMMKPYADGAGSKCFDAAAELVCGYFYPRCHKGSRVLPCATGCEAVVSSCNSTFVAWLANQTDKSPQLLNCSWTPYTSAVCVAPGRNDLPDGPKDNHTLIVDKDCSPMASRPDVQPPSPGAPAGAPKEPLTATCGSGTSRCLAHGYTKELSGVCFDFMGTMPGLPLHPFGIENTKRVIYAGTSQETTVLADLDSKSGLVNQMPAPCKAAIMGVICSTVMPTCNNGKPFRTCRSYCETIAAKCGSAVFGIIRESVDPLTGQMLDCTNSTYHLDENHPDGCYSGETKLPWIQDGFTTTSCGAQPVPAPVPAPQPLAPTPGVTTKTFKITWGVASLPSWHNNTGGSEAASFCDKLATAVKNGVAERTVTCDPTSITFTAARGLSAITQRSRFAIAQAGFNLNADVTVSTTESSPPSQATVAAAMSAANANGAFAGTGVTFVGSPTTTETTPGYVPYNFVPSGASMASGVIAAIVIVLILVPAIIVAVIIFFCFCRSRETTQEGAPVDEEPAADAKEDPPVVDAAEEP